MRQTKAQKQAIALESYIKSTSSLPSYASYCKWCDKRDKALFTAQTFSRYYWKARGIDSKSKEGKDVIKYYKDNVKDGDIDISTVKYKQGGIYARKFGDKDENLVYALDKVKLVEGNKVSKDLKSNIAIAKDFVVSFDLPICKKMHLYVCKDGAHIRYSDGYFNEAFKNKRKFVVEDFRF